MRTRVALGDSQAARQLLRLWWLEGRVRVVRMGRAEAEIELLEAS